MSEWIDFWKIVCILGLVAFYVLVIATIPLGLRDLIRLFRHLRNDPEPEDLSKEVRISR